MEVNIRFKNTDHCEVVADFVKSKLNKLKRFESEKPQIVDVCFFRRNHSYAATFHYSQGKMMLDAQALGGSFAMASEQGIKRIVSQLLKKTKMSKSHKKKRISSDVRARELKKTG